MSKPRPERVRLVVGLAVGGLLLAGAYLWRSYSAAPAQGAADDLAISALRASDDDDGFARAVRRRPFHFPRDHALHADYRSEWWYFTGHLVDAQQHAFGFQVTFFRFELDTDHQASPSAWRTPRIVLAHFALTDVDGRRFHQFERLSRALPSIAGASIVPPAVWLDDWRIEFEEGREGERWHLRASGGDVTLDLVLHAASAVVAQGDGGLSRKSAAPGNASYYYSVPRLHAAGTLSLAGDERQVDGSAWLDREWSTSALAPEQAGWDWFALQLDAGESLMFYRLRLRDGTTDPQSAGSFVSSAGTVHRLAADDVDITELDHWQSPVTGRTYPSAWRLRIAHLALDLELTPRLAAQEWHGRLRYWEGAVTFSGEVAGSRRDGLGYVELTGY